MYSKSVQAGVNPVLAAHASNVPIDEELAAGPSAAPSSEMAIGDKVFEAIVRRHVLQIPGVVRFTSSSFSGGLAEIIGRRTTESSIVVDRLPGGAVDIAATVVLEFDTNIPALARQIESVIRTKVPECTGVPIQKIRIVVQDLAETGSGASASGEDSLLGGI